MFIRLCFGFWEIANPLGNLIPRGWLAVVFPCYMTCLGKNSPDKVITKVRVMFLLSVRPLIGTDEEFLAAIVILRTETYEQGV